MKQLESVSGNDAYRLRDHSQLASQKGKEQTSAIKYVQKLKRALLINSTARREYHIAT